MTMLFRFFNCVRCAEIRFMRLAAKKCHCFVCNPCFAELGRTCLEPALRRIVDYLPVGNMLTAQFHRAWRPSGITRDAIAWEKTLPEAYKAFAERVEASEELPNIGALLDRYLSCASQGTQNTQCEPDIHRQTAYRVWSYATIALPTKLIYQYVEKRSAKTSARREIEILSHAYTKAVEWGYVDRHPFKGEVRLKGEKPRTRYVEDWEVLECLALSCQRKKGSVLIIQASIRLKLLTGLRRGDLLRIKMTDIREDGIHVTPHKTASTSGKSVIYEWSESLRQAIEIVKSVRPVHISPWLFCNKFGESYLNEETGEAHGWDSMWARFMTRVLSETKITARFT